jgi:DNA (cytosine-5)-methyltransferase 1
MPGAFSVASVQDGYGRKRERNPHPDLIHPLRVLLEKCSLWTIENVVGAPLRQDLLPCGKMFGLDVARHRVFECHGFNPFQPRHVYPHVGKVVTVAGNPGGSSRRDGLKFAGAAERRDAMGSELKEAIPPLYTRHIGRYMMLALKERSYVRK